jgi:hypothetical protein
VGISEPGIGDAVRQRRQNTADQVEDDEATMPHGVFDIVSEQSGILHIAEHVQPTPM